MPVGMWGLCGYSALRMTGICLTFLPIVWRCKAKTISGVRSKKPMSFFQLMPHLQCCKPMNCCFIFLPQMGQTLLLFPIAHICLKWYTPRLLPLASSINPASFIFAIKEVAGVAVISSSFMTSARLKSTCTPHCW